MSLISRASYNLNATLHRLQLTNTPSIIVSRAQEILNLPNTLCQRASQILATKTLQAIGFSSPLIPPFFKNKYDASRSVRAEILLQQLETSLKNIDFASLFLSEDPIKPSLNTAVSSLLSFLLTFLKKIDPYCSTAGLQQRIEPLISNPTKITLIGMEITQQFLRNQVQLIALKQRDTLKERVLLPFIQDIDKKTARVAGSLALQFSFDLSIRSVALSWLTQTLRWTLDAHDYSSNTLWNIEKGLQAYVWGPTLYHSAKIGMQAWQSYDQSKHIERLLIQYNEPLNHLAKKLNLSEKGKEALLKMTALLLTQVPPTLLMQPAYVEEILTRLLKTSTNLLK